jgi:hypothetical protein
LAYGQNGNAQTMRQPDLARIIPLNEAHNSAAVGLGSLGSESQAVLYGIARRFLPWLDRRAVIGMKPGVAPETWGGTAWRFGVRATRHPASSIAAQASHWACRRGHVRPTSYAVGCMAPMITRLKSPRRLRRRCGRPKWTSGSTDDAVAIPICLADEV